MSITANGILFLDLEQTLIDSWGSRILLNGYLERIAEFIKRHNLDGDFNITALGLFSYAVIGEHDLQIFRLELQSKIEEALGLSFDERFCLTVKDMIELYSATTEGAVINTLHEFYGYCHNKAIMFFTIMPILLKDHFKNAILIDDLVQCIEMRNNTEELFLRTIDVVKI